MKTNYGEYATIKSRDIDLGEWKKCVIGELGEVVSGGTPKTSIDKYWHGGVSWITPRDMSKQVNRKYISKGDRNITTLGLNNSSAKLLPKGTVIFTSRAPIGYLGIAMQDLATNQGFKSIIVKDCNSNEFVYYLLKFSIDRIISMAGGSTFKEINASSFKEIEVDLPPLQTQQKIASILSSLDDKIENNRKTCEKLEEIAQAIFKRWFVDFEFPNEDGRPYKSSGGRMVKSELGMIPEGWGIVELNRIGNLMMGLSPKSESYNIELLGIPLLNGAADFNNSLIKAKKHTTRPTRVCKKNDLVFCIRATIGNITFADQQYCLGRGVAAITPKKNIYVGLLYFSLLMSMEKLKGNATGSVILGISKSDINNMKVILPDDKVLAMFSEISSNVLGLRHTNVQQSDELKKIRDSLLPKLMSGELRIEG
ncbi:MAG: restriction endonuclease subunit S [Alkaliphilus sp.]